MITRLSEEEAYALLGANHLAHLGCVADGYPYVIPINYVFNGGYIFSHSLPGRKIDAMRASPRVCLQVDEVQSQTRWRSALAFGTFEELNDAAEKERALSFLLSFFPQLTPVESFITTGTCGSVPIIYRIRIERITGISEG